MSFNTFYLNSQNSSGIVDGSNVVIGGKLGISTNTPQYALDVSGTTNTNDLIVNNANISNFDLSGDIVTNNLLQTKAETTKSVIFDVVVSSKTANAANSSGSSSGYFINTLETPFIHFTVGKTYRFNQNNSTNSSHPILFYLDENKTSQYSTGVTTNGTAGSSGSYVEIQVTESTPQTLYYQCQNHSYMGNKAYVEGSNITSITSVGTLTAGVWNASIIEKQYINTETISINDISDVSFNAVSTTINQPLTWDISNQVWDASTTISVDTINEKTNNNGVVIEGVTVKNNGVTAGSNGTISASNFNVGSKNVISATAQGSFTDLEIKSSGGNIGLLVFGQTGNTEISGTLQIDDITEKTSAHGVDIEGVIIKNNSITTGSNGTISATNFNIGSTNVISAAAQGTFADLEVKSGGNTGLLVFGQTGNTEISGTLEVSSDISFNGNLYQNGSLFTSGGGGGLTDLSATSIADLSDVSFNSTSTTQGSGLIWNNTDKLWEPGTLTASITNKTTTTSGGGWVDKVATNTPAYDFFGDTVYDGNDTIYFVGGRENSSTVRNYVWGYTLSTNTWAQVTTTGTFHAQILEHSVIYYNNCIYVFGGWAGSGSNFNELYKLDLTQSTPTWSLVSTGGSISAMRGASVTMYNSKLIVFGGFDGSSLNDVYEIDLTAGTPTWTQLHNGSGTAPSGRYNAIIETYQNKVFIFSGSTNDQQCWEFDLTNNTWSQVSLSGTIPAGRVWSQHTIVGNNIYIYGGGHPSILDDFSALDVLTGTWSLITANITVPQTRGHGLTYANNKIYLYGNNQSTTGYTFEYTLPTTTITYNPVEINKLSTKYALSVGPNYDTASLDNSGSLIVEGNVGIGISDPSGYKLEVVGDISFNGNLYQQGSIIPTTNNTYSLGDPSSVWKDVYIGPGSLYIDGQKVLESDANTIVVSADENQNLKMNTTGSGVMQIESANGIQINSTGSGNIELGSTGSGIVRITDNLALNGNVEIFNDSSDMVKINDSLLVTGDISFNGNLYKNGSLFTSGGGGGLTDLSATSISDLSDISFNSTSTTDGQALVWNSTDSVWEAGAVASSGSTIDETTDVSVNNLSVHHSLDVSNSLIVSDGSTTSTTQTSYWYSDSSKFSWSLHNDGTSTAPVARNYHTSVIDNSNNIIIFGGEDSTSVRNDVWKYSITGNSWSELFTSATPSVGSWDEITNAPSSSEVNGAAVYNNEIYMYYDSKNNFQKYNPSTNTWTSLTKASSATFYSVELLGYKGHIYAIDGVNGYRSIWDYNISSDSWSQLSNVSDTSHDRYRFACMAYDGYIYVVGGRHIPYQNGFFGDIWKFNLSNNTWTEVTGTTGTVPTFAYPYFASNGDNLYIFGGTNGTSSNTLYIYNVTSNTITSHSTSLSGRESGIMSYYENNLYFWGGYTGSNLDDLIKYDLETHTHTTVTQSGTRPSARRDLRGVTIGNTFYALGGYLTSSTTGEVWRYTFDSTINKIKNTSSVLNGDEIITVFGGSNTDGYYNSVYNFSLVSNNWAYVTTTIDNVADDTSHGNMSGLPNERDDHTFVKYNNKAYLFGGKNGSTTYYDTWEYDLSTKTWTKKSVAPSSYARYGHTSIIYNGNMYVFGGYDGSTYFSNILKYNISNNSWSEYNDGTHASTPSSRYGHVANVIQSQMIIFGGISANGAVEDSYAFDFGTNTWHLLDNDDANRPINPQSTSAELYNTGTGYKWFVFGGSTIISIASQILYENFEDQSYTGNVTSATIVSGGYNSSYALKGGGKNSYNRWRLGDTTFQSVSFWYYRDKANSGNQMEFIFDNNRGTNGENVLFFQTSSGGNLDKVHFTSSSSAVSKLYIDGVDESSAIDTGWSSGWSSTTYADNTWHHFYLEFASSQTSPITFGQPERADGFYADPSEYVKWGGGGKFDNVRIFSGALTTTQINILLEKNNKTHVADISNVNVTTTTTRDVAFTFNKNNDGRIGVHTLNPTTTLDVGGDINFSGSLYQNGSVVNIGGSTFNQNTNLTINSLTTINDISFSGNLYQNGALFTGIDITSDVSLNNMDISGVLATNKSNNQISLGAHIIPTTNAAFDLGNAEYKIRHLFLSDNSLWIGDDHKIDISGGKMKFKKRKKTVVPTSIENNGGTANSALSFAGVGQLSNMKLHHWVSYAKTLSGLETASVKDIFQTEISADWEEDLEMNSGGGIDATSDVSLNNLDIHGKLDISGYLQSTDSAVSTPYTSLNVTNSLFISITTALSSGNTTGITMNTLVYDNDTWIAYVHNSNYTKMIRIKAIYQNNTVYIGITESKFFSGSQTSDYIKTNWGSATTGAIYPTNSNGYGANVVISIFGAQQTAIDLNDVSTIQNTPNSSWDVFTNITSSQIYTENNSVDFTADVHIETFTYGTSNQSSDDRIKHNEEPITNALSILAKITPKHYFKTGSTLYDASHNFALNDQNHPLSESGSPLLFKKDYTIETGIIAQEIQSIPELRFAVQNTTPLGVDYNSIHCTHIAATKELHQQVKSQQTHIEEQQQEIEHLKMVNQDINSQLNTAISELQTIKHYLGI